MALLLSDDEVRQVTDLSAMVDLVEEAFREEAKGSLQMPPRVSLASDGQFLRLMPARLDGMGLLGFKSFHGSLASGVRYLIVLCSLEGEYLGLVDAAYLTAARTGATTAVAARHLAAPGAATVGLIGSGLEAETNLAALAAVRELVSVKVYSRSEQRRQEFADRMSTRIGVQITAVDDPRAAVGDADMVVVATNTGMNGPTAYRSEWMEPGQVVLSIGATSPFLRELEASCFSVADRVVFDAEPAQVLEECGDLLHASDDVRSSLSARAEKLCSVVEAAQRPTVGNTITLFKSVGNAAQDLASASSVLDRARELGLGLEIGQIASNKTF